MKYSLITKTPLALARKPIAGKPISRERDNLTGVKAPTGCKYIPNLPTPSEAPQDGFRWARKLTLSEYGWEEVAIPVVVPSPVSMAQFREELSKPAYEVDGTSLRVIVQQAVEASGIVMLDWWDTAATVERFNVKVLAMAQMLGVSDDTLDAIFTGANLN